MLVFVEEPLAGAVLTEYIGEPDGQVVRKGKRELRDRNTSDAEHGKPVSNVDDVSTIPTREAFKARN